MNTRLTYKGMTAYFDKWDGYWKVDITERVGRFTDCGELIGYDEKDIKEKIKSYLAGRA